MGRESGAEASDTELRRCRAGRHSVRRRHCEIVVSGGKGVGLDIQSVRSGAEWAVETADRGGGDPRAGACEIGGVVVNRSNRDRVSRCRGSTAPSAHLA